MAAFAKSWRRERYLIMHRRGPVPAPFASPIVAVLVGLGLVLGGHVEQTLLDLRFVGDLGEPPTLGGHLTKIISVISHCCYRFTRPTPSPGGSEE